MLLSLLAYLYPNPNPFLALIDSGCQETVTGDLQDFEVVWTFRQRRTATELEKAARRRLVLITQYKDLLT